jgi:hypothetical protein
MPHNDVVFNVWQGNFVTNVDANATPWGVPATKVTELKGNQTAWTTVYGKVSNWSNTTPTDRLAKKSEKKTYTKYMRGFVKEFLINNSKLTDSDRELLGLTVKSETRTPVAVPVSYPTGKVDVSVNHQHSIHFKDSKTGAKAKPEGVYGAEIWTKVGGEAPKADADYTYLDVCTKTPYLAIYEVADVAKNIYYRMRWINTRGKHGPWSTVISGIVTG